MGFFARFRRIIALCLGVALLIALLSLSHRERQRFIVIENAVGEAVSPVLRILDQAGNSVFHVGNFFIDLKDAYTNNKKLKKEVADLRKMQVAYNELKSENQRLNRLLGLNETHQYDVIANAHVVAQDPSNWSGLIEIDKGSRDGVFHDAAVVNDEGLVGRVVSVSASTAKVILVTDPQSAVGGRIERSRDVGVINGSAAQVNSLEMVNIPRDADVRQGDLVVTSGLGGIFPPGIPIGKVQKVSEGEFGILRQASVTPTVHFGRLEEVAVIKMSAGTAPEGGVPTP